MTSGIATYNLAGTVRNQGLPVAGSLVSLYDVNEPAVRTPTGFSAYLLGQARTGSKGEFKFDVKPGRYRIDVEPGPSSRFLRQSSTVRVSGGSSTNNVISLTAGMVVTGSVSTKDGARMRFGEVAILGIEPSSYRAQAKLDETGTYSVVLPRGQFHVAFHCHQSAPESSGSNASSSFVSTKISVLDVQSDGNYDFVLPELVKFAGEIFDPLGKPVANALIEVVPAEPRERMLAVELGLSASCFSNSNGRFFVFAQPGLYDVSVEPQANGMLFGFKEASVKLEDDRTRRFQLTEGFRLRGQVLFEDKLLSECLIRVQGLDKDIDVVARTDDKGQFHVSVPSGNYKLIVSAHPKDAPSVTIDGVDYFGMAAWTRVVVVGRDTHVAVRLQQGTPLNGKIIDDRGHSRAGIRVSIFADGAKPIDQESLDHALASSTTDGEGKYCLFVSPGTYWVAVHTDLANATKVEVGSEPTRLDITWKGWCVANVEILGADERKLPRCRVAYAPYGTKEAELDSLIDDAVVGSPRGLALTDDSGCCELTLPANVYVLRVCPPPDSLFQSKLVKQVSISSGWSRTFKLAQKISD